MGDKKNKTVKRKSSKGKGTVGEMNDAKGNVKKDSTKK